VCTRSVPFRYRTNYHFAGVNPDTRFDRKISRFAQLGRVAPQLLQHPQRRIKRVLRMILMSHRSAEQREDAIAGGLHDIAVVAVGGIDHELKRGIDNGARLFRIEILLEFSRSLNVSEKSRYGLSLAVRCVRRGRAAYANWRVVTLRLLKGGDGSQRGSAVTAEFFARLI